MSILKREYKFLCDCTKVFDFLNSNYCRDRRRGVPGPFFEYAECFPDFTVKSVYRIGIWEDNETIVALVARSKPFYRKMATSNWKSIRRRCS